MRAASENRQPRRVLFALLLLLVALAIILVRDRDFWFGADESTIQSDMPAATPSASAAQPAAKAPVVPAKKPVHAPAKHAQPKSEESGIVATNRTAVAPLNVEVVAGDKRSAVHPGSVAKNVEIGSVVAQPAQPTASAPPATNAAEREAMPIGAALIHPPEQSFEANYPALAQHMSVQGSVVLQALIGADGVIQDLRVMSGPAILVSAAQQAVREWRFKPFLENGQPVETKAKITVNFTIKVADNMAKVS